jgi:hypothetical protein
MQIVVRALSMTMLAALLCGGCIDDSVDTMSTGFSLTGPPDVLYAITSVEVAIYDDAARCMGSMAEGGAEQKTVAVPLGDSVTVSISEGWHVFAAQGFEDSVSIAAGCTREFMSRGQDEVVVIDLQDVAATVDAGAIDAGPTIDAL